MPQPRRALLLQGPPGRFWSELGAALVSAGVETHHIRVCTADALFFRAARGVEVHDWRGALSAWPAHVADFIGDQTSRFDLVCRMGELDKVEHLIARKTGRPARLPKLNPSKSKAPKFHDLSTAAQKRLLEITEPEYALLNDYFTPPSVGGRPKGKTRRESAVELT